MPYSSKNAPTTTEAELEAMSPEEFRAHSRAQAVVASKIKGSGFAYGQATINAMNKWEPTEEEAATIKAQAGK